MNEETACRGKCSAVNVRLDTGIHGFIFIENFSDSPVINPEMRVRRGQRMYVRIKKIIPERFSVECVSKTTDLRDKDWELRPQRDTYYDDKTEEEDKNKEEGQAKAKKGSTYIKRVITHTSFHNISYKEAESMLAKMDMGDCIIRPSSKGNDHLTVTWKVYDNIYQHIDITEKKKSNAFSLGQSLLIGPEEFEDLDEIIARHINPMSSNSRDIITFKYFRSDTEGGNKPKCEAMIMSEKRANPSKIHYFFSASKDLPGKVRISNILLSFLPFLTVPVHADLHAARQGETRVRLRHSRRLPVQETKLREPQPADEMVQGEFCHDFLNRTKTKYFPRRNTSETRSPGLRTPRAEAAVPGPRTVESLLAGADQPAGLLRAP